MSGERDKIEFWDSMTKDEIWEILKKSLVPIPKSLVPIPKMVFSVIGDSDSFVPKPWPKSKFQSALITAAKNAGDSWIFDGGRDKGISGVVFNALKEYDRLEFHNRKGKRLKRPGANSTDGETTSAPLIQLIGIQPTEIGGNSHRCIRRIETDEEEQSAKASTENQQKHLSNQVVDIPFKGKEYSKYSEFLVALEKAVSGETTTFSEVNLELPIPILIVLLEGDTEAIKHVAMAVKQELPVVIVQGTGKAADLIVECFECSDIEKMLKRRAPLLFGTSFSKDRLTELKEYMKDIADHQWLIHIFNINTDDPIKLSQIAGEAVICGWSMAKVKDPSDNFDNVNKQRKADPKSQTSKEQAGVSGYDKSATSRHFKESDTSIPGEIHSPVPPAPEYVPAGVEIKKVESNGFIRHDRYDPKEIKSVTNTISKPRGIDQLEHGKNDINKRRYVLDAQFMSPSSLPLHFYFQYQTLQETNPNTFGDKDKQTKTLLLEALKANRTDYIQVLMDDGVVIEKTDLKELYVTTVKCEACSLDKDIDKCLHMQWILLQENKESAEELLDPKRNSQKDVSKEARGLCREMLGYKEYKKKSDEEIETNVQNVDLESEDKLRRQSIIEDMLLWSIFANRQEIAEIIWQKSDNQLLSGILCTVLLKHLSKEASSVKEHQLSSSLLKHSMLFQNRCLAMMDKIYEFDPNVTIKIVDASATVWDISSSPMTFAHENKLYDIVAHIGCQKALNRKWYNKLPPDWIPVCKSICSRQCRFIQSPVMRFIINYIFFATMLVSYSSYVMTSIDDANYSRVIARLWEYYTYFWGLGDLIEEMKRLGGICATGEKSHRGFFRRLWQYVNDFWNLVDILSYILLIIALFVRHFKPSEDYNAARRLFSLSVLVMYLRFLQIFLINRRLGPQLLMIKEMLKDLMDFLYIVIIIIIGVGIYYHANLWPNHLALFGPGSFETWSIWKVFYYPYWQLYGETFNEYLEGKDTSNCISNMTVWDLDQSQQRCPREEWSVPVVSAFYFLISNLLLVNLVIAKFSYTFDAVQTNSDKLWKFQRYSVITDYESKIPSPFNLFYYPFRLPYLMCQCKIRSSCCKTKKEKQKEEKKQEKRKRKNRHRNEIQKIFAGRCLDANE